MPLEVLALGLFSGLRPGTSLAAVLVVLESPRPRRLLLVFTGVGLAWSWAVGLLVVGVFHGADVGAGGSTVTAVLDIAFGVAALGLAAGLGLGRLPRPRRNGPSPVRSRFARDLRDASSRDVAVAGIGTHLPGLVYLAALNAIASDRPRAVDVALQVATYDVLWLLVPLASLVLEVVRPGAARARLEVATAWSRRHEHAVLVVGSLVLGSYLVAKGTTRLLT